MTEPIHDMNDTQINPRAPAAATVRSDAAIYTLEVCRLAQEN